MRKQPGSWELKCKRFRRNCCTYDGRPQPFRWFEAHFLKLTIHYCGFPRFFFSWVNQDACITTHAIKCKEFSDLFSLTDCRLSLRVGHGMWLYSEDGCGLYTIRTKSYIVIILVYISNAACLVIYQKSGLVIIQVRLYWFNQNYLRSLKNDVTCISNCLRLLQHIKCLLEGLFFCILAWCINMTDRR